MTEYLDQLRRLAGGAAPFPWSSLLTDQEIETCGAAELVVSGRCRQVAGRDGRGCRAYDSLDQLSAAVLCRLETGASWSLARRRLWPRPRPSTKVQ